MNGLLDIRTADKDNDFKKSGYYNNIKSGAFTALTNKLIPFFKPVVSSGIPTAPSVTVFKLQGLDCSGNMVVEYTLTNTLITYDVINGFYVAQYNGQTDLITALTGFSQGMYRYWFSVDGTEWISEPFWINENNFVAELGDFNNDFNNDFLI